MKNYLFILSFLIMPVTGKACITCNKELQEGIYNSTFYPNLFIMLSAFIVVGVIVIFFSTLAAKNYSRIKQMNPHYTALSHVPLTSAAIILGIGMGGFADGIVFHQLLQWHGMLTNKIPPTTLINKSINMFWDGVFHCYTLLVTLIGVILMWRLLKRNDVNHSGYLLSGGMLLGWGLFNIVEGVIDHQILKLHNVNESALKTENWNIAFLIFSAALLLMGWLLVRIGSRAKLRLEII